MSAATPPDARATTTIPISPPRPGSTARPAWSGSVANILTPQAFSNKFDRRTPYSMQWLVNVQRELANNLTFEAGYVGSISRHLESYRGVSAAVPGPGTVASRSPYPNFGLLVLVENGGNGNYNSMGSKLTKRFSQRCHRPGFLHLVEIHR